MTDVMLDAEFLQAACDAQHFKGVDTNKWTCVKSKVREKFGIIINKDSGTISMHGFTVMWNHNPTSQTLMVQCTDHPFFVSCSTINTQIQDIARICGIQAS
jgi:hypothetical protein